MSQDSYTCIEQLDLAAKQLHIGSPSYARFALILTDNVVELIIHKICIHELAYNDLWIKLGKPKYTSEERRDATGQRFDKKVKFCKNAKKITSDQAEAIQICHKYRNELYHTGLKYNDIIWDLAWYYYEVATDLLGEVYPDHSWFSGAEVTPAVKKHAGDNGQKVLNKMHEVARSLSQIKPLRKRTLSEALSLSAQTRVQEIEDALNFLVENDPHGRSEEQTINELQLYDYIQSDDSFIRQIWQRVNSFEQRSAAIDFIRKIWKPKYKSNPLPNFYKLAKKISEQENELKALKMFERFKKEFSYFSKIIEDAAIALDMHIQQQIDAMRGK